MSSARQWIIHPGIVLYTDGPILDDLNSIFLKYKTLPRFLWNKDSKGPVEVNMIGIVRVEGVMGYMLRRGAGKYTCVITELSPDEERMSLMILKSKSTEEKELIVTHISIICGNLDLEKL